MRKQRIDTLLVERGLVESRARARALVMAGKVFSGGHRLDKAGTTVAADAAIELRGADHPWVSRGGIKLAHALDDFRIDPSGHVSLDIGASTGGFTDVLLRRGAARVYAVDVGHGQFAWALRGDPRVVLLERTNARYLSRAEVPEQVGLITCDASFIGLARVLPAGLALARPDAHLVALIKPQFEVGRGRVGTRGVVSDPALHAEVCARVRAWLEAEVGWPVLGITESPIRGPHGNKEFLIAARRG